MKHNPGAPWMLWALCIYCVLSPFLMAVNPPWLRILFGLPGVVLAVAVASYAYLKADARLRRRGKSGPWLLVFFGPLPLIILSINRIPPDNVGLIIGAMTILVPVGLGFAFWGARTLSAEAIDAVGADAGRGS